MEWLLEQDPADQALMERLDAPPTDQELAAVNLPTAPAQSVEIFTPDADTLQNLMVPAGQHLPAPCSPVQPCAALFNPTAHRPCAALLN